MDPKSIQKLTEIFSKFPTVGKRTASRFSYYLLRNSNEEVKEIIQSLVDLKNNVKFCSFCFNPLEGKDDLCEICSNNLRDGNILCIVEKEADLLSIERTKKYKGLYFVLGGTISGLNKKNISELRFKELIERINSPEKFLKKDIKINELILAFNSTIDGEATSLYIERMIQPLKIKTTRLAKGLPTGGELEYFDDETLVSAIEGRR